MGKLYIDLNTEDIFTLAELRAIYEENKSDIWPDWDYSSPEERAYMNFDYWLSDAIAYSDLTEYTPEALTREIYEGQAYCI